MIAHYGELFISRYGESENSIWHSFLKDLTESQLNTGLDNWKKSTKFDEYPPNPKQFVSLCKGILCEADAKFVRTNLGEPFQEDKNQLRLVSSHKTPGQLARSKQLAEEAFKQMKVILGRPSHGSRRK